MITNTTSDYNSRNGPFVRSPTTLKAFKMTPQEVLGIGRWYGTMPKECMAVWVIETADPNEVKATKEMLQEEAKERKKKETKRKRRKKKEQKR
jgi:hypothetical protein